MLIKISIICTVLYILEFLLQIVDSAITGYKLDGETPICWYDQDGTRHLPCPEGIGIKINDYLKFQQVPVIDPISVQYTIILPTKPFEFNGFNYTVFPTNMSDISFANIQSCRGGIFCSPFANVMPPDGILKTTAAVTANVSTSGQASFNQNISFADTGVYTLIANMAFQASYFNGTDTVYSKWDAASAVIAVVSSSTGTSGSTSDGSSSKAAAIWGSIGSVLFVALAGCLIFFIIRRRHSKNKQLDVGEIPLSSVGISAPYGPAGKRKANDDSNEVWSSSNNSTSYYKFLKTPTSSNTEGSQGSFTNTSSNKSDGTSERSYDDDVFYQLLYENSNFKMACIESSKIEVIKCIGSGSYGDVMQAKYSGGFVAIKTIHRTHDEGIDAFFNEIRLAMNLRHPCIVQFMGVSQIAGYGMVAVSEYMEKGDLTSLLASHPKTKLTWELYKLRIAHDSVLGLAYLHGLESPVIHRDLKSRNILIGLYYNAKLADFGLSRAISRSTTMTAIGSNLWLAPEVIRGDRFDEKIDIFSFGIVLSELDTHQLPYYDKLNEDGDKMNALSLAHSVAFKGLRPSLSTTCLPQIRRLVEWCTEDNPNRRPTAIQLLEALSMPNLLAA